jgi:hypothetical protein
VKPSVEQIENLLALKRHECPEDGYWQDFCVNSISASASEWFHTVGSGTWGAVFQLGSMIWGHRGGPTERVWRMPR